MPSSRNWRRTVSSISRRWRRVFMKKPQKKPPIIQRLFVLSSLLKQSVAHVGDLSHQAGVHRIVGCGVSKQVAQHVAAGLLLLALPTENISDLWYQYFVFNGWGVRGVISCHRRLLGLTLPYKRNHNDIILYGEIFFSTTDFTNYTDRVSKLWGCKHPIGTDRLTRIGIRIIRRMRRQTIYPRKSASSV